MGASPIQGDAPIFSCRVIRTSVRYTASYAHCVHIVYLIRWHHSAPRVRVIFSHGGEGREPLAGPMVGFQYISCLLVPRLVEHLAFASRVGVLWRLLVYCVSSVLLVFSSRRRLLVVASCRFIFSVLSRFCHCVLLVADADAGWGDVVRGASHVGSISSWASRVLVSCSLCISSLASLVSFLRLVRLVSRFAPRFVFIPFLSCSCRHPWRGGRGVVWMSLSSCGQGGRGSCSRISDWLGWSIGSCRFIQLGFSYSHLRVWFVLMA